MTAIHKWTIFFLIFTSCLYGGEKTDRDLIFTEDELEWLADHPVIRVANEMDWPPFDFNESGTPKGLAIDHISLLGEKIGIEIEYVYGYSWTELIEMFKSRQIDVMPVFYRNEERKAYTLFSEPYYRGKLGVFINSDYHKGDFSLAENKIIAIETSHGSIPLLEKKYPDLRIVEIDKQKDLVIQLATGKVDAIIGNPFVYYYLARENQVDNILLSGYIDMTLEEQLKTSMHIGVRKDWPLLHRILQKAMMDISGEEMDRITEKWADVSIVEETNWILFGQIADLILLIFLFLLWNNRKLKSMVIAKTETLNVLNRELESKVEERTAELRRSQTMLNETARIAKVGGWEVDLKRNKLSWTDEVYRIHELGIEYEPTVKKPSISITPIIAPPFPKR